MSVNLLFAIFLFVSEAVFSSEIRKSLLHLAFKMFDVSKVVGVIKEGFM